MELVSREKRRIGNGNRNLSQMLLRKGWAWSRSHVGKHHFRDVFSKRGLELVLTGVGSWADSKSDFQLYFHVAVKGRDVQDEQVIAREEDFTFRKGRAFFNNDEVCYRYLRNLNDLCELAHQISG